MRTSQILIYVLLLIFASGCSFLKKDINLRKNVFLDKPIWESQLQDLKIDPPKTLGTKDFPGLSLLVSQVFAKDIQEGKISVNLDLNNGLSNFTGENNLKYKVYSYKYIAGPPGTGAKEQYVLAESQPFAPAIGDHPVTKGLLRTFTSSVSTSLLTEDEQITWKLPADLTLSTKDFESFVKLFSKNVVAPFHKSWSDNDPNNPHFKIHVFAEDKVISLAGLLHAYLMNYYNGQFIDRTGGIYSKPKLGLTITNETITAFLSVFLEAVFDYAILADPELRVPIVYKKRVQ